MSRLKFARKNSPKRWGEERENASPVEQTRFLSRDFKWLQGARVVVQASPLAVPGKG